MKSKFIAFFGALALVACSLIAGPAAAQSLQLPGLGVIGGLGAAGGLGTVGGTTGSTSYSGGQATGWKSPGLDGNGTVSARYDSFGLAESGIRGSASIGAPAGQNGAGINLNVASGALAATAGSLTAPGTVTSSASGFGGGQTSTSGGGIGIGGAVGLTGR